MAKSKLPHTRVDSDSDRDSDGYVDSYTDSYSNNNRGITDQG